MCPLFWHEHRGIMCLNNCAKLSSVVFHQKKKINPWKICCLLCRYRPCVFRVSRHALHGTLVAEHWMLPLEHDLNTVGLATFCQYFGSVSFHGTALKVTVWCHMTMQLVNWKVWCCQYHILPTSELYHPVHIFTTFLFRHLYIPPNWLYLQKNVTLTFIFFLLKCNMGSLNSVSIIKVILWPFMK
jgi:hypothetical protein